MTLLRLLPIYVYVCNVSACFGPAPAHENTNLYLQFLFSCRRLTVSLNSMYPCKALHSAKFSLFPWWRITVQLRFFPRDYIQEFMAESVSFLLRNAPINQLTKGIVLIPFPAFLRKHLIWLLISLLRDAQNMFFLVKYWISYVPNQTSAWCK